MRVRDKQMRAALEKQQAINKLTKPHRKNVVRNAKIRIARQRQSWGQLFTPRIQNGMVVCAYCGQNEYTVKSGIVIGKQRYFCRWCERRFTFN